MLSVTLLKNETITIKRRASGVHRDGHYRKGDMTTYSVSVNVQPAVGRDLLQVPEGDRTREHKKIYSKFEIKINDIIIRYGIKYEVQTVSDWKNFCIDHYESVAVKMDNQNEEI